jgi:hypothetical protein
MEQELHTVAWQGAKAPVLQEQNPKGLSLEEASFS